MFVFFFSLQAVETNLASKDSHWVFVNEVRAPEWERVRPALSSLPLEKAQWEAVGANSELGCWSEFQAHTHCLSLPHASQGLRELGMTLPRCSPGVGTRKRVEIGVHEVRSRCAE